MLNGAKCSLQGAKCSLNGPCTDLHARGGFVGLHGGVEGHFVPRLYHPGGGGQNAPIERKLGFELRDVVCARRVPRPLAEVAHLQGTFREHSGNIQGTYREHSGNIQGELSGRP
jgi:hypothetical protein